MLQLVMLVAVAMGDVPGMVNPGTPRGVPPSYDCAVRIHAWEFGKATLPQRGVSVDLALSSKNWLVLFFCHCNGAPVQHAVGGFL